MHKNLCNSILYAQHGDTLLNYIGWCLLLACCWWAMVCLTRTLLMLCSIAYFFAFCMASCWWDVSLGSVTDRLSFLAPGPDNTGPVCEPWLWRFPTKVSTPLDIWFSEVQQMIMLLASLHITERKQHKRSLTIFPRFIYLTVLIPNSLTSLWCMVTWSDTNNKEDHTAPFRLGVARENTLHSSSHRNNFLEE